MGVCREVSMKKFTNVMRVWLVVMVFCLSVIGLSLPARAQVLYGSILGTVQDPSAAAVPNAVVTIVNTGTGESRSTRTNDDGAYSFADVPEGSYTLTIGAAGFHTS